MIWRRTVALGAALISCAGIAGCTSSPPPPTMSGAQGTVLHLEKGALNAAGVHVVDVATVGPSTSTLVGTISPHHARLFIENSLTGEALTIWRTPTMIIVSGTASSLTHALGITAAHAAGLVNTWISVAPGDAPYAHLVDATTIQAELQPFIAASKLTRTTTPTTWIISGRPASSLGPGAVSVVVQRTTSLPVRASLALSGPHWVVRRTVVFANWGVPARAVAPVPRRTYASLRAG